MSGTKVKYSALEVDGVETTEGPLERDLTASDVDVTDAEIGSGFDDAQSILEYLDHKHGKNSVLTVSTSNITLSGEQTLNGLLTSTSRVGVTAQSTASQNGVYITAAGSWSRAADFSQDSQVVNGTHFLVSGDASSKKGVVYIVTKADPITVDTTDIDFLEVSSPAHTIASHSDTTATGAELETLTDGSDSGTLHTHYIQNVKDPVLTIADTNITLSGNQTINGESTADGDRVAAIGQTSPAENGIYIADSSTWSRSSDTNSSAKVTTGMNFTVYGATAFHLGWHIILKTEGTITLDTTSLTFEAIDHAPSSVDTTAIHKLTAGEIAALTEITVMTGFDHILLEDQSNGNAKRRIMGSNLVGRKSGESLAFNRMGTSQNTSYKIIDRFSYAGNTYHGVTPQTFRFGAKMNDVSGSPSGSVRIYDSTNSQQLGELTGITSTGSLIYSFVLSQTTATAAIWEFQCKVTNASDKVTLHGSTVEY